MTNETKAPVDVLAVMDAMVLSAQRLAAGEPVTSCEATVEVARQTRAAIAELIEADREYDAAWAVEWGEGGAAPKTVSDRRIAAGKRRAAALANVGGA
jgi:hypothetical protein